MCKTAGTQPLPTAQARPCGSGPKRNMMKVNAEIQRGMTFISFRTVTTLDLSQKAEKGCPDIEHRCLLLRRAGRLGTRRARLWLLQSRRPPDPAHAGPRARGPGGWGMGWRRRSRPLVAEGGGKPQRQATGGMHRIDGSADPACVCLGRAGVVAPRAARTAANSTPVAASRTQSEVSEHRVLQRLARRPTNVDVRAFLRFTACWCSSDATISG